jgi:hypothetical protein
MPTIWQVEKETITCGHEQMMLKTLYKKFNKNREIG